MDDGDRPASDGDADNEAEPVEESVGEDIDEIDDKDTDEIDDGGFSSDRDRTAEVDTIGDYSEEPDADTSGSAETPVSRVGSAGDEEQVEQVGGPKDTPPDPETGGDEGLLYRFRHENDGALMWLREMLSSVAIVLVLGLILFAVSGVWPPMVAVESGSMEPNMEVGDLVLVTEPGRFAPDAAGNDIGVVTHEAGVAAEYRTFGSYGSVVIFQPPGRTASPIIHRAMFRVEEGENWYDRADDRYHNAANCEELRHCPAPHGGFITLGDNNGQYDQASGLSAPVKADWVTGVARLRVPYLGYVRLIATGQAEFGDLLAMSVETNGYSTSDPEYLVPVVDRSPVSSGIEIGGVWT